MTSLNEALKAQSLAVAEKPVETEAETAPDERTVWAWVCVSCDAVNPSITFTGTQDVYGYHEYPDLDPVSGDESGWEDDYVEDYGDLDVGGYECGECGLYESYASDLIEKRLVDENDV